MRVLVVHHGPLPTADAPTTGGAIRAWHHVEALRAAGHEVVPLARAQDEPGGFRSPAHLRRLAERVEPDWILCVAQEEAPPLAPIAPLVVDLYAPRVLEAAWEGTQAEAAEHLLRAVHVADEVLVSNPRQRWFHAGVLAVCGWGPDAGLLVPLAATPTPREPDDGVPIVLLGGQPWPWADATETLRRAVAHVRGRAEVHVWGLPPIEGVAHHAFGSWAAWRRACARATVALDRYAPNRERELAVGFRHMDALGAGLPLVTDPAGPLADEIRREAAGWVDEPLEEALDAALAAPRHAGAARLGERYARANVSAPLVAWTPRRRAGKADSPLHGRSRVAAAEARARAARAAQDAAEAEVAHKRDEVARLVTQTQELTGALARLSEAVQDVAGFRREAVAVLGTRAEAQRGEAEHARRELEIARAELEKKDLEFRRLQEERDRVLGVFRRITGRR